MSNHWHFVVWPRPGNMSRSPTSFAGSRSRIRSVGTPTTTRRAWGTSIKALQKLSDRRRRTFAGRVAVCRAKSRCGPGWSSAPKTWRWGSLYRRTQERRKNRRCWPNRRCCWKIVVRTREPAANRGRAGRDSAQPDARPALWRRRVASESHQATRPGTHVPPGAAAQRRQSQLKNDSRPLWICVTSFRFCNMPPNCPKSYGWRKCKKLKGKSRAEQDCSRHLYHPYDRRIRIASGETTTTAPTMSSNFTCDSKNSASRI